MQAIATIPKSVKPTPSKAVIIEALAILQHHNEQQEIKQKRNLAERAKADAFNACYEYLRNNFDKVPKDFGIGTNWNGSLTNVRIDFTFMDRLMPKNIKSLVVAAQNAEVAIPRNRSLDTIRDEIRNGMKTKVDSQALNLINNPEMKKALEDTLEILNKK